MPDRFVYNPTVTDPVELGRKLKASGIDVVLAGVGGADLTRLVQGIKLSGVALKVILASSGYNKSLVDGNGSALGGLTTALTYLPFGVGGPGHQAYLCAMAAYAPEPEPPVQELALATYLETDLFRYGLEQAGPCPTRSGLSTRCAPASMTPTACCPHPST